MTDIASMTTCHHETNLNAIVEGAWTTMVIDPADRRTFAWAAAEIDRLRAENAALRAMLGDVSGSIEDALDRAVAKAAEGVAPC